MGIIPIALGVLFFTAAAAGGDGAGALAQVHYNRGLDLRRRENYDAALEEFRQAVSLSPDFIEAHRELQNIEILFGRQEEIYNAYRARLNADPRSAPARYLFGRILDDPAHQEAEFDRAMDCDPGFFWGHFGKAMVCLRTGRKGRAGKEIDASLLIDPLSPEGRRAGGIVLLLSGRDEEALDLFLGLIEEDSGCLEAYRSALFECRILGRDGKGKELSARASELFPRDGSVAASNGYFLARDGDIGGAVAAYETARALEPLPPVFLNDLRRLYAARGRHQRAVALWKEVFGRLLEDNDNEISRPWRRLKKAAGPAALVELARAYAGMGWWGEAAAMGPALRAAGATGAGPAGMLESARAHDRLTCAIEDYARRFSAEARKGKGVSFREEVARLGDEAGRAYGRRLLLPGAIHGYPGLRWLGDAPGRPQPLLEILRRGYREIIFFDNLFARQAEFKFAEVVSRVVKRGDRTGKAYRETIGYVTSGGPADDVGGLAYPPFDGYAVFFDHSKWGSLLSMREARKEDPLDGRWFIEETEEGRVGEREILYSRLLERRLFERACLSLPRSGGIPLSLRLEDSYIDIASRHEYQHLLDLNRLLPVWRHPVSGFIVACRNLFLPSRVEMYFEERAILRSLAFGGNPYLALLSVHAQLNGKRGPHAAASRRALGRIVGLVAEEPLRFPSIDFRRNLMNQLYLMEGEEVREIARRIYDGL